MRRGALLIAGILLLAVPVGQATTASGLHGVVRTPSGVCLEGGQCGAPTPGVMLIFTRNGLSRRIESGDAGKYRILLRAGTYTVRSPDGRVVPGTVRVTAGRVRGVDFLVGDRAVP